MTLIDPDFFAWVIKERRTVTTKDIQPGNDDQRKAVFAKLADDGESGGIRHEGKLEKSKVTARTWNAATHKLDLTETVDGIGIGDYAYHKSTGGGKSYTVTHKPTGMAMIKTGSRQDAEEITRRLHGSHVKIPTKIENGLTVPDTNHPGFARAREKFTNIAGTVQGI